MRIIKLIILIFGLSGIECRHRFLKETSDRDNKLESLAESAILTLLSCYEVKVDTVGGIGITESTLVEILVAKQPLPVKLFREIDLKTAPNKEINTLGPHKLHLFVIETSSGEQFKRNLWKAISSQASAQLSTYLIINWPSKKNPNGCSEASNYLLNIWKYDVLSAFYVCIDKPEDRVFVYTFNPYTSKAPAPWMLNKTIVGPRNHPWSLFVREYHQGDKEICNNFDFVKTHDLGGYPIRAILTSRLPFDHLMKHYGEISHSPRTIDVAHAELAFAVSNGTVDIFLAGLGGKNVMAGNTKENMTLEQIYEESDIFLEFWGSVTAKGIKTTIPVMSLDYVVLTHHAGEKSQLDKLVGVFDRRTRCVICLVIIVTVLFFRFFMRQPLGTAIMNVIRMIGNSGLVRVPTENAPRLYLAGVFILVVTIIGTYQGLLAALLTKPTPLPEINTLEDLANSDHTIYVTHPTAFDKFFTDPRFEGRLVFKSGICKIDKNQKIVIRTMDACLETRNNFIQPAIKQNLHISKETMLPAYAAYRIKRNWALEERFNEIILLLANSRSLWHIYERNIQRDFEAAEQKRIWERSQPKIMKLSNLGFAFAFLGIGLSLATVVFVIEIAWKRRQSRQRSMH